MAVLASRLPFCCIVQDCPIQAALELEIRNVTAPALPHNQPNRLAYETSPYLRQHAHNPVDWYPWGEEALARARDEDKPHQCLTHSLLTQSASST